jgi:hypothetical protein
MESYETPGGKRLPLLGIPKKVKRPDGSSYVQVNPYMQVQHRLVWFREVNPDWTIRTEVRDLTLDSAIIQSFIESPEGRVISTGMKRETAAGWEDFLEKAETGAIGRALAAAGFGTQFAVEMEDGAAEGAPVDSPSPTTGTEPAGWVPPPPVAGQPPYQPSPQPVTTTSIQGANPPSAPPRRPFGSMTAGQEGFLCDLVRKKLEPGANTNAALVAALNVWAGTQYAGLADISFPNARLHIEALKAYGMKPDSDLPF